MRSWDHTRSHTSTHTHTHTHTRTLSGSLGCTGRGLVMYSTGLSGFISSSSGRCSSWSRSRAGDSPAWAPCESGGGDCASLALFLSGCASPSPPLCSSPDPRCSPSPSGRLEASMVCVAESLMLAPGFGPSGAVNPGKLWLYRKVCEKGLSDAALRTRKGYNNAH